MSRVRKIANFNSSEIFGPLKTLSFCSSKIKWV